MACAGVENQVQEGLLEEVDVQANTGQVGSYWVRITIPVVDRLGLEEVAQVVDEAFRSAGSSFRSWTRANRRKSSRMSWSRCDSRRSRSIFWSTRRSRGVSGF